MTFIQSQQEVCNLLKAQLLKLQVEAYPPEERELVRDALINNALSQVVQNTLEEIERLSADHYWDSLNAEIAHKHVQSLLKEITSNTNEE